MKKRSITAAAVTAETTESPNQHSMVSLLALMGELAARREWIIGRDPLPAGLTAEAADALDQAGFIEVCQGMGVWMSPYRIRKGGAFGSAGMLGNVPVILGSAGGFRLRLSPLGRGALSGFQRLQQVAAAG